MSDRFFNMGTLILTTILVSLVASGWSVPADPKVKPHYFNLVKFPVPVTNTSSKQNQEYGSTPKCKITMTGAWTGNFNMTTKPMPPRVDDILKLHVDLYGYKNIWFVTAKGNLTRRGAGQGYSFDVNVCNYRLDLCPIEEGDTRHIDENVFLPSAYVDKGIYDGCAEVFDQNGKSILVVTAQDCAVV